MTATQEKTLITVEVLPADVTRSLPDNFTGTKDAGEGFSNLELSIPTQNRSGGPVSYMISYDGEGELLANVINKPAGFTDSECEELIQGFFMADDEDDEDNEEDEEA